MAQSEIAMEAYNAYWANSHLPMANTLWMIVILVVALLAIWQARTFVSKF